MEPMPPYQAGDQAARPARTSGKAIASLVLGIVGIFAVPLIASVLAIFLGSSAKREIQGDPAVGGEGLASAGVILGWIGVALMLVGFLLIFGLAV